MRNSCNRSGKKTPSEALVRRINALGVRSQEKSSGITIAAQAQTSFQYPETHGGDNDTECQPQKPSAPAVRTLLVTIHSLYRPLKKLNDHRLEVGGFALVEHNSTYRNLFLAGRAVAPSTAVYSTMLIIYSGQRRSAVPTKISSSGSRTLILRLEGEGFPPSPHRGSLIIHSITAREKRLM